MFVVVWQFEVAEDKVSAFEAAYGPDGSWAKLFRNSPNYIVGLGYSFRVDGLSR